MKKKILFAIAILTLTMSVKPNTAGAYITNGTVKRAIIARNYLNMKYQCSDNNVLTLMEAKKAGEVLATQFGQLNTQFLQNLGVGVERNISYATLMVHANTFICHYLKNNFDTNVRIIYGLGFKPNLYISLNMEQFVKQNFWIMTHITPQVINNLNGSPAVKNSLSLIRKINIDIFKDIMFERYNKAQAAINEIPIRNALFFIWNGNYSK